MFDKSIISKGPPNIRFNYEPRKQEDQLPRSPFRVFDKNGDKCKLYFETEGIFTKQKPIENKEMDKNNTFSNKRHDERIFYSEIHNYKLFPVPGYEKFYSNLVLFTKFGKKVYYFIPKEYTALINNILKEEC